MNHAPLPVNDAPGRATRVSIVIPCYNHAHFLSDAVNSALGQTWPHCEVIVVDDGSRDGSASVARRHPRVTVIRQDNRGLSAARNVGLEATTGDVVIFLDADDRLWPDAALIAVDALASHPAAAMVYGRCRIITATGAPGRCSVPVMRDAHYEELLRDNALWTPAVAAFRRDVFARVGRFDEGNTPAADYDLYLRIARDFPIVAHDATVVDYRQHPGNMSRDPVLMLDATLAVLEAQRPHITTPQRAAAYREAVAKWRATYGERLVDRFRAALRQKHFGVALHDARHLLRLYPAGVKYHVRKKLSLMLRGPDEPTDGTPDVARSA
jgi:glycosyltransferase involved in cell wall biosynthesis